MSRNCHRLLMLTMTLSVAACSDGQAVATAALESRSGTTVTGSVTFTEKAGRVEVVVEARNLTPGGHGVHVHSAGDCSAADGSSAGGHFNPSGGVRAGPTGPRRHAGDLGNLEAGPDGTGTFRLQTEALTVSPGPASVLGRALIIHGGLDDLTTQLSGNSGPRVACGGIR